MGVVMRVDVVPFKWFGAIAAIGITSLIVAIIIGATGAPVYDYKTWYAYNCPGNSHTWNPQTCTEGVRLSENNTYWEKLLPKFGLLNRVWILEVTPFYNIPGGPDKIYPLKARVTLLGKNDAFSNIWTPLAENDTHTEDVACKKGSAECSTFLLIYEEFIKFNNYKVIVDFPESWNNGWIGDVKFTLSYGHASFSQMDMTLRILFMIAGLALVAFFLWTMHKISVSEWAWEQRSIAMLLAGSICFNNPFYPLTYAVRGWFFPFLSSLLEVAFFSITLLFWLLMVDKLRRDELRVNFSLYHLPKLITVGVFGVLSLILFAWLSIRDETDPIYGTSVTGITVLFYMVAVLWTAMMVWVAVLVAMTVPVVSKKPYLMTRFLFFGIPTAVAIISILAGVMAGSFGPLRRNTLSFVYYLFLFNIYVYVLTWGYWPVKEGFTERNPSESTRLTFATSTDNI